MDARQSPATSRWRDAAVVAALSAIVLFPVAAVDAPRPSFLGWHMYSAVVLTPTITVSFADGTVETPSLQQLAARIRPEVDYGPPVAAWLCARDDTIVEVTLERSHPRSREVFSCATG